MVPGPEDVETNGSKNKTRLVAARPPGRLPAVGSGVADCRRGLCGIRFCAGLEATDRDDLVPQPNPDGEGAGSTPQDGIGAVVGVRYHSGGSMKLNACILHLVHMVYL